MFVSRLFTMVDINALQEQWITDIGNGKTAKLILIPSEMS